MCFTVFIRVTESNENCEIVYQLIWYRYFRHSRTTVVIGTHDMLMPCCAYSCKQYGLYTQYMLLTNADNSLCLQLYTVRSVDIYRHSQVVM